MSWSWDISWHLWRGHNYFRLLKLQAEDDAQGRQGPQHPWLWLALHGATIMQLLHLSMWSPVPQTLTKNSRNQQQ